MALVKRISELPAKGSNLDATDLYPVAVVDGTSPSGYKTEYVTGQEILNATGGTTIYTGDGNITTARTATIGDTLTWDGGRILRSVNSRNIVEVTRAPDLPTTLVANTTYIIRGSISFSSAITINVSGCEIIGLDRTVDEMEWTGTGSFLRVTDVDFTIKNVRLSSTNGTSSLIRATNYTLGVPANNYGRTKVLQIFGCEFRNIAGDVLEAIGFELVDINNTLFWYIEGANGLQFTDVRHLEMSSCELYNWFDEATGTTYSTASMINITANQSDNQGCAVVNINSCIVHPEQTQNGIEIDTSSTTAFGTISSNTFIDAGITTGELFLPVQGGLPDYSQTATYNYDVWTNQGLLNSRAGILMTMNGNTAASGETVIGSIGVPVQIETDNLNAQTERVRWSGSSGGQATYLGTKQVYSSIHATITYEKVGGGTDEFSFFIYKNGSQLAPSEVKTEAGNTAGSLTMTYATLIEATDYLQFWVANNDATANIKITDWQIVIRE